MNASTVFLVDDDAAVRGAVSASLQQMGFDVSTHASAESFLENYDPTRRGCLILDVCMPGMSGIELQQELAARGITLPVLFITGCGAVADTVKAIKAGAVDFLEKPVPPAVLVSRIEEAFAQDACRAQEARERETLRHGFALLTAREREVIMLVVKGASNKEIARRLAISFRTVEKYRAAAMIKLQVNSVAELCRAMQSRLLDTLTESDST